MKESGSGGPYSMIRSRRRLSGGPVYRWEESKDGRVGHTPELKAQPRRRKKGPGPRRTPA
jgi:hypothetical protein